MVSLTVQGNRRLTVEEVGPHGIPQSKSANLRNAWNPQITLSTDWQSVPSVVSTRSQTAGCTTFAIPSSPARLKGLEDEQACLVAHRCIDLLQTGDDFAVAPLVEALANSSLTQGPASGCSGVRANWPLCLCALPALKEAEADPILKAAAADAIENISRWTGWRPQKSRRH